MKKTKIEWCDTTWNPVWGCFNNCPYCYARKIAKRFGSNIYQKEGAFLNKTKQFNLTQYIGDSELPYTEFWPTFINSNFDKKFPYNNHMFKGIRIFVNSMSDINHWETSWMYKVLGKISDHPNHTFIFLTKHPSIYHDFEFPGNCWLGVTLTNENSGNSSKIFTMTNSNKNCKKFISFEPFLFEQTPVNFFLDGIDWIIIGAQNNPYIAPMPDPLCSLIVAAEKQEIPIFMKDSLKKTLYLSLKQEFPKK